MAWIESHQSLRQHPKVIKAARILGVSKVTVIGHLHCLWWWSVEYANDGDLSAYEAEDIADASEWEGDAKAFVDALLTCGRTSGAGFLERTDDGRLCLHDWDEYAGRLIEYRRLLADRSRRKRDLYDDETLTRSVRARDGDNCRYCGVVVNWLDRKGVGGGTYDHVDPDGPNTVENIVVSCRRCNSIKGRRTPEHASMHLLPAGIASPADNLPGIYLPSGENPLNRNQPTEPNQTEPGTAAPTADDPELGAAILEFERDISLVSPSIKPDMVDIWLTLQSNGSTDWWHSAIAEAVAANKRSWSYMRAILQTCLQEGHPPGRKRRNGAGHANGSKSHPPVDTTDNLVALRRVLGLPPGAAIPDDA